MAFRVLKQEFDPSNIESGDATKYAEVIDAYRVLSDPKLRAEYDKDLASDLARNPNSLYELLQVQNNADATIIRYAYRFLATMHHPDNPDSGDSVKFRMLTEAWRILSDEKMRAEYDKGLFS